MRENAEEGSAVVGVCRKGCHEQCGVFPNLRERVDVFLLTLPCLGAAVPALGAAWFVFGKAAAAICAAPLHTPTTHHQTHSRWASNSQRMHWTGAAGSNACTHLTSSLGARHGSGCCFAAVSPAHAAVRSTREQRVSRVGEGSADCFPCSSCVCALTSCC